MKICREHKKYLRNGTTYQLTGKKECSICLIIKKYMDYREKIDWNEFK